MNSFNFFVSGKMLIFLLLVECILAWPPQMTVTEGNSDHESALTTIYPHHLLSANVSLVALRCEANYPVMWSPTSLDQSGIVGTESSRTVGAFHDPSTYKYSITIDLELDSDQGHGVFICHAVAQTSGTSTIVTFKALGFSLNEQLPGDEWLAEGNGSSTLYKWMNPNLTLTFHNLDDVPSLLPEPFQITCCLKAGAYPKSTAFDLTVGYAYCLSPQLCQIDSQLALATTGTDFVISEYDEVARCISANVPDNTLNQRIFSCRKDSSWKWGHPGYIEPTYAMDPNWKSEELEYRSLKDSSKSAEYWQRNMEQSSNYLTFYEGDKVEFKCQGALFLYATGFIWEKRFRNGTSEFVVNNRITVGPAAHKTGYYSVILSVDLKDSQLTNVFCHLPLWNSTKWVTLSQHMNIKRPTKPRPGSDESNLVENVEMYTRQSVELHCDLEGDPIPEVKWISSSAIYLASHTLDWALITFPEVKVTVSKEYYNASRIPEEQVSCEAWNIAGNATKVFHIQATKSFAPAMTSTIPEDVTWFLGDENKTLNCLVIEGVPAPEFIWLRNGVDISTFDNNYVLQNNSWSNVTSLVFKKLRLEDQADFSCTATNFLGRTVKVFSVKVRERIQGNESGFTGHQGFYEIGQLGEITIVLAVLVVVLVGFVTYVWVIMTKRMSRLEARVEYTVADGNPDSNVTISTF